MREVHEIVKAITRENLDDVTSLESLSKLYAELAFHPDQEVVEDFLADPTYGDQFRSVIQRSNQG